MYVLQNIMLEWSDGTILRNHKVAQFHVEFSKFFFTQIFFSFS